MTIQFWYVRHGETLFNRKGRVQGVCDSPLTDTGRAQALRTANALADQPFDRVFVSPSGRARETAAYLLHHRHQEMEVLDNLHELDFGRIEGSRFTSHSDEIRQCYQNSDFSSFGGESLDQIQKRIELAFGMILRTCHDGDRVLIVGHGSYERFFMNHELGIDFSHLEEERDKELRLGVPIASIMTFTYGDAKFKITNLPTEPERYQMVQGDKTIHFYYMRHGETRFNVWSRMQGISDSPLTEKGMHEIAMVTDALGDIPIAAIYSSTIGRAWRTASFVMTKHHDLQLHKKKELDEVNFGNFEGIVSNDWKEEIHTRNTTKGWQDVEGESFESINERIMTTLNHVIAQSNDGDTVLLIGHGNYYCHLIELLFGIPWDEQFDQARKQGKQAVPTSGVAMFDWVKNHYEYVHAMMTPEEFWNSRRGK